MTDPIDYLNHHLDSILVNVDNANGSLIQVNTEKELLAPKAAVRYVIIMTVKKYSKWFALSIKLVANCFQRRRLANFLKLFFGIAGLPQSYSGRDGIQVPIKLHLIGGFGNCIPTRSSGIHGVSSHSLPVEIYSCRIIKYVSIIFL